MSSSFGITHQFYCSMSLQQPYALAEVSPEENSESPVFELSPLVASSQSTPTLSSESPVGDRVRSHKV